ncbi:hypothetical protein GGR53DRAFT_449472 [Hypoxylon sp. FL1150]|nr:hypothetical protein GGR53DRAFT_449472 [Hypoxylon sp. FL1150]
MSSSSVTYPNQQLVSLSGYQADDAPDNWAEPGALQLHEGLNPLVLLPIGGQELERFCHNRFQKALLALPGNFVIIVRGSIHVDQVITNRPSYVNALLISSRGQPLEWPCEQCRRKTARNLDGYSRPFPVCVRAPGHFGGACNNCKFQDHAKRCSVKHGGDEDPDRAAELIPRTMPEYSGTISAPAPVASEPLLLPGPEWWENTREGSVDNPIVLE